MGFKRVRYLPNSSIWSKFLLKTDTIDQNKGQKPDKYRGRLPGEDTPREFARSR